MFFVFSGNPKLVDSDLAWVYLSGMFHGSKYKWGNVYRRFTFSESDAALQHLEIHLSPNLSEIYQSQQFPKALWLHQPAPGSGSDVFRFTLSELGAAGGIFVSCPMSPTRVPNTIITHKTINSTLDIGQSKSKS